MKLKDISVQANFHPMITQLAFDIDVLYKQWGDELVITSGSEHTAKHGRTSLHYATPACAFDVRTWDAANHNRGTVPAPSEQQAAIQEVAKKFCAKQTIPNSWVEVILENDHIHVEYQPKSKF